MDDLFNSIFKRKSTRQYDMTPLSAALITEIKAFADVLKPLYENIKVEYEIVEDVKNIMPVKAPHYFIISSEKKEGYLTNVGFMFQQMDLFLSNKELGSCWLGMARPTKKLDPKLELDTKLEFVIVMAFGKATGSPYRELSEFKRKPLSEISDGKDTRLECAKLSPSASNTQNWFFKIDNNKIHCYQKKLNPLQSIMYDKMNKLDMGLAICHLYIATEHEGKRFLFTQDKNSKELTGHTYIGTVE